SPFYLEPEAEGGSGVLKKLDRIMGNLEFIEAFPGSYALFQLYRISNHSPANKPKPFKYYNFLTHKADMVSNGGCSWTQAWLLKAPNFGLIPAPNHDERTSDLMEMRCYGIVLFGSRIVFPVMLFTFGLLQGIVSKRLDVCYGLAGMDVGSPFLHDIISWLHPLLWRPSSVLEKAKVPLEPNVIGRSSKDKPPNYDPSRPLLWRPSSVLEKAIVPLEPNVIGRSSKDKPSNYDPSLCVNRLIQQRRAGRQSFFKLVVVVESIKITPLRINAPSSGVLPRAIAVQPSSTETTSSNNRKPSTKQRRVVVTVAFPKLRLSIARIIPLELLVRLRTSQPTDGSPLNSPKGWTGLCSTC
nr:hypothetical protein [Tanacetum cinerariifolium]